MLKNEGMPEVPEHKSQSALQVCSNVLKPLFIDTILTEETFLGPTLIYQE
jgi:hypothetical protein